MQDILRNGQLGTITVKGRHIQKFLTIFHTLDIVIPLHVVNVLLNMDLRTLAVSFE